MKTAHLLRRAFTLTELLVTLAVIAIIASLLLPAVARSKESARAMICMNNSKQIGLATGMYCDENRNRIPSFNNWLFTKNTTFRMGAQTRSMSDNTTGRLFPYVKAKEIYLCPTDRTEMRKPKANTPRIDRAAGFGGDFFRENSYAMSCQVCHANDLARWKTPSKTAIFSEALMGSKDRSGIAGPGVIATSTGNLIGLAYRHGGRSGGKAMAIMGDLSAQQQIPPKKNKSIPAEFWDPGYQPANAGRLE